MKGIMRPVDQNPGTENEALDPSIGMTCQGPGLQAGASHLHEVEEEAGAPVFVLSVCWRTGSTLLQRLLIDAGILVWGEAGGALDALEDAYERYRQMLGEGGERFRHGYGGNGARQYARFREDTAKGAHEWVACMNPPEGEIRAALRQALESIYAAPARRLGYARWGIKEVQSGARAARWLCSLFPGARVIVLARNPLDTLRSIKRRRWMDRADTPRPWELYARHWSRLATELRALPGALAVRYEDLVEDPSVAAAIGEHVEADIDFGLIRRSRADWKAAHGEDLTWREVRAIRRITREAAAGWGYRL